jgi:large subunit ribosomal protein L30
VSAVRASRAAARNDVETHIRVTQVRSGIGTKPKHRGTLRALGLRGVGFSRVLPDRPDVRGMVARVPHLVSVEEADEAALQRERSAASRRARRTAEGKVPESAPAQATVARTRRAAKESP